MYLYVVIYKYIVFCLFMCLFVYWFIAVLFIFNLSIYYHYLFIHLFVSYLFLVYVFSFIYPCPSFSFYLFIYLSVYPYIYLSVYLFLYLFIYLHTFNGYIDLWKVHWCTTIPVPAPGAHRPRRSCHGSRSHPCGCGWWEPTAMVRWIKGDVASEYCDVGFNHQFHGDFMVFHHGLTMVKNGWYGIYPFVS